MGKINKKSVSVLGSLPPEAALADESLPVAGRAGICPDDTKQPYAFIRRAAAAMGFGFGRVFFMKYSH